MRNPHPAVILVFLSVLCVAACGRTSGLTPLEISHQTSEIARRSEAIVELDTQLESQLAQLEVLANSLSNLHLSLTPPFPLDLFRHAAMACATEAQWTETEPGTDVETVAKKLGLQCNVLPLPALESELSVLDATVQVSAVDALRSLDKMRILADELDIALHQTPQIVRETEPYIALARADLRQIETELNRRRPEYSSADFETSKARLQGARTSLDRLESLINTLTVAQDQRQTRARRVVQTTYRRIALLGEP